MISSLLFFVTCGPSLMTVFCQQVTGGLPLQEHHDHLPPYGAGRNTCPCPTAPNWCDSFSSGRRLSYLYLPPSTGARPHACPAVCSRRCSSCRHEIHSPDHGLQTGLHLSQGPGESWYTDRIPPITGAWWVVVYRQDSHLPQWPG